MTDFPDDRAGLDPGNVSVEPSCRRGPAGLPLKPRAWNRLRLAIRDDRLAIEVNGVLVYERAIEPTNFRTFGLFHFADESEARIRGLVYRGDWPRSIGGGWAGLD